MTECGLKRLLIIKSGRFDYAEVELFDSIHLAGKNNVGKTSLVAALQFLFIDDQDCMHFRFDIDATRRYYFPSEYSWLLFECVTSNGTCVVGARGLGPLQQFRFQRFTFRGKLDPIDFLDENRRVRSADQVLGRLGDREFTMLEPGQLRAALTTTNDSKGLSLQLVPLRQRSDYGQFRQIFKNLHRLAHLRQKELKQLLVDVYQLGKNDINLVSHFQKEHQTIQRQSGAVRSLRDCEMDAHHAIDAADRIALLQNGLPRLLAAIERGHQLATSELDRELSASSVKLDELTTEREKLAAKLAENQAAHDLAVRSCVPLEQQIGEIETGRTIFETFDEAETQKHLAECRSNLDTLIFRIAATKDQNQHKLKREVSELIQRLDHSRTILNQLSKLVAVHLGELLPSHEIEQAFRVLNPGILEIPIAEDIADAGSLVAYDLESIRETLRAIASRVHAEHYQDAAVTFGLSSLPSPDLSRYDAARLNDEINSFEETLEQRRGLLGDIEQLAELQATREGLRQKAEDLDEKLKRFTKWKAASLQEPSLRAELERLTDKLDELSVAEGQQRDQLDKLRVKSDEINKEREEKQQQMRSLTEAIRVLPRLPQCPEPPLGHESQKVPSGAALGSAIKQYQDDWAELESVRVRRDTLLANVTRATYTEYATASDGTLKGLREALDELPQKEKAVEELWASLMASVKAELKNLVKTLEVLGARLTELTRYIRRFSISNLKSVRLEMIEQTDVVADLRTVIAADVEPLFARPGAEKSALDRIQKLLDKHQRLNLVDLFGLRFHIVGAEGEETSYDDLDQIESDGTTVTLKVIVNLMLLSSILQPGSASIPFFLDEVDRLDDDNLVAVLNLARQLGFIAIVASPKPREYVEAVYYLNLVKGRVSLTPDLSQVQIHRRTGEPRAEAGGANGTD